MATVSPFISTPLIISVSQLFPTSCLPLPSCHPSCTSLLSGLICYAVLLTWLVCLKSGDDRLLTWHPWWGRGGSMTDRQCLEGWCYTVRCWWRRGPWWRRWGDDKVKAWEWTGGSVRGMVVSNRRQRVNTGILHHWGPSAAKVGFPWKN